MDLILLITAGTFFVGLLFDAFKKDAKNDRIVDVRGKIGVPGNLDVCGKIGDQMLVKPGGVFEKDGRPYIVYPEFIILENGKWISDGRNYKLISKDKDWEKDGNSWKYVGKY
jgi:hypothetical protein